MKPATLRALNKSIDKWEKVSTGDLEDRGMRNCALCQRFAVGPQASRRVDWGPDIGEPCTTKADEQCPVYAKTGQSHCLGSPYEKWFDWHATHGGGDGKTFAMTKRAKQIARAEVKFLKGLLPK